MQKLPSSKRTIYHVIFNDTNNNINTINRLFYSNLKYCIIETKINILNYLRKQQDISNVQRVLIRYGLDEVREISIVKKLDTDNPKFGEYFYKKEAALLNIVAKIIESTTLAKIEHLHSVLNATSERIRFTKDVYGEFVSKITALKQIFNESLYEIDSLFLSRYKLCKGIPIFKIASDVIEGTEE